MVAVPPHPKEILHHYLRRQREQLLAKLDGLGERQIRWPITPTGTNLLGLVKHVAGVQLGYLSVVFDRPADFPASWEDDGEVNADMWATADETRDEIVEFFHYSCRHADDTIGALELDSPGRVPWWTPGRQDVTLHLILVHLAVEVARHAGHADIVREKIDGRAGDTDGNLPDLTPEEWAAYRTRLEVAAEEAARRR